MFWERCTGVSVAGPQPTRHWAVLFAWSFLVMAVAAPATASEKKEGESSGGMVRHSIWVPLISPGTQTVLKTITVIIEIHATTDEAKNFFTDRMPLIQDGYLSAVYGKAFTNIGHDVLVGLLDHAVDVIAGDKFQGQYNITVQINPKPQ